MGGTFFFVMKKKLCAMVWFAPLGCSQIIGRTPTFAGRTLAICGVSITMARYSDYGPKQASN